MKAELSRRRDECVELKTMVATLSMEQSKSRKSDRVEDATTDGELESAYRYTSGFKEFCPNSEVSYSFLYLSNG